jgi:hypothetical protein
LFANKVGAALDYPNTIAMKTSVKILSKSLNYFLFVCLLWPCSLSRATEQVLWRETFEGEADLWSADRGGWQFGLPINPAGPTAIQGARIASVGLRVAHPSGLSTSFIRDEYFLVPPADQNPRLRFHHWFSLYGGDFGQVRIRPEGGQPEGISENFSGVSAWAKTSLSLSKYSGQRIRVEFYFESNGDSFNSSGWSIDDVALVTGPQEFSGFENFEGPDLWSFQNWTSTHGNWQIGTPTQGPGRAYSGTNCAAVNLSTTHPSIVNSVLLSPPFVVPSADQNPQLRFHHWFSTYGGDFGEVQIIEESGATVVISPRYDGVSDWARAILSLTNFGGKKVRIGFRYVSNPDSFNSSGWFIDDVGVSTGDFHFRGVERFETGASDWAPTRGNWQIGKPTHGPGAAFGGTNCAAVHLSQPHPSIADSALVSPPFVVPAADQNPRLRFQHWFSMYGGDFGEVRVREGTNAPQSISDKFSGNSDWTRATLALSSFAGKTIQVELYFASNSDSFNAAGWFIDDLELLTAAPANAWPALQVAGAQIAPATGAVSFTAKATDPDAGQFLTYSLDPSTTMEGAVVNAQTGAFTWEPTPAQRQTKAHYVRVRVTDNGTPPRSTSESVPILMPDGVQLQLSHGWEPFHIKVAGAVPGLVYTHHAVTSILGNSLFPDSSPSPITNFVIRARGESAYYSDPKSEKFRIFVVKGERPAAAP